MNDRNDRRPSDDERALRAFWDWYISDQRDRGYAQSILYVVKVANRTLSAACTREIANALSHVSAYVGGPEAWTREAEIVRDLSFALLRASEDAKASEHA